MATDAAKGAVIRGRVLRGTVSNYVGKFIAVGTWFFLTPFILHQLGASGYGLWVLVGSVVNYGALLDLGIASAVTKYVAEYLARGESHQARGLVATTLRLYSLLGLVVIVLSAAIAPIFPTLFNVSFDARATASWLVLLMGVTVGISIPCMTATAVLQGLQRYDVVNLIGIVGTLVSAAATVAVLLLGGGVLGMVAINIPVALATQAASIWFINRIAPELRFGWRGAERGLAQTILSFSWSVFAIHVASRLQTQTDEIVIGAFLPVSAVTPYAIARRLSEAGQLLTAQFMKVLLPLASELDAEDDRARLRSLYIASTRLTLAVSLPIASTVVVLAGPILTAWVGAAYAGYTDLVAILSVAGLISISQWPAGLILQGMARHKWLGLTSVCSAVANLALSIALLPSFGLTGVAFGTLIPTAAECLGVVLPYAMRLLGVSARDGVREILVPAVAPVVPMGMVLYGLQRAVEPSSWPSIVLVAGPGLLVYAIGYLSFGATRVERETYRGCAVSTLRFAEACLKRS